MERIISDLGYDVTNYVEPSDSMTCSICGYEGRCPFCDTDNGCAPVCRACYDREREMRSHCGRSCTCGR